MKTKIINLILILLFTNLSLFSQKVSQNLFEIEKQDYSYRSSGFVDEATYLKIDDNMSQLIYQNRADEIELVLPINDQLEIVSKLKRFDLYSDDFILTTSNNDTITEYKKVLAYRGRIINTDGFISISFLGKEVIGIIYLNGKGSYNLGKIKNSRESYIIYSDKNVKIDMGINCNTIESDINENRIVENKSTLSNRENNCVKMYLEGDFSLYQSNNSSVSDASDYMSGLFSQVASLYNNESINMQIKEIKIWTEPDGYNTVSSSQALYQFKGNNLDNDADLCHLIALGGEHIGGVAWVDVLCKESYKFGYSNVSDYYNDVPTYSWSVYCVTHEIGHNLGSSHTHDCVWGPNNDTQIDDCGSVQGYSGGDCYDPDNPNLPTSGTIMSYCHLVSGIGVDFNLGFGEEPGDLIRLKVNNSSCLSACNNSDCDYPINFNVGEVYTNSVNLEWEDSGSPMYEIEFGKFGFVQGEGEIVTGISSLSYSLSGLESGVMYECYLRTKCGNGNTSDWSSVKQFRTLCVDQLVEVTLPYFQGWEDDRGATRQNQRIYCSNIENWEFETEKPGFGRVKFGEYCPDIMVISGNGALIMDRQPYGELTANSVTLTLNMSKYIHAEDLKLKFSFRDKSDESQDNDRVWIRGNNQAVWIDAYYLDPGNVVDGQVVDVEIDIDSVLNIGSQLPSESFQIRFGQEDDYAYGSDGIAFDDIEITGTEVIEAPYFEYFTLENDDWEVEDVNNDGRIWGLLNTNNCDPSSIGIETTTMMCMMNDWLYSPGIYMEQGVSYNLSFSISDKGDSEKLEVYLSDGNNSTSGMAGRLLFKDEVINNNDCSMSSIIFSPDYSGIQYIAFHNYSHNCMSHSLIIDDFGIEELDVNNPSNIESSVDDLVEEYYSNGVSGDVWHMIYSGDKIIAAINPQDQELGKVTVEVRDGGEVETYMINNKLVKTIPRYFNFESDNDFSNDVIVRIYIDESDLIEYNNAEPITNDDISAFQINHYDGLNENCFFDDNENNGVLIESADIISSNQGTFGYYFEFSVNSFSEFLIHQNVNSTLPISYDVEAIKEDDENIIELTAFTEIDMGEYVLQGKEAEGVWRNIDSSISKNINNTKYLLVDNNPDDKMYYRVVLKDNSGLEEYSKILFVERELNKFFLNSIYPNPTNGDVYIKANVKLEKELNIIVYDLMGKQVHFEKVTPINTEFTKTLDLKELKDGLYILSIVQENNESFQKICLSKNRSE